MTHDSTPLEDADREQLKTLFRSAATLAEARIVETAGRAFLADLLADPGADVIVQVACKAQAARVLVRWPHHGAGLVKIADLMAGPPGRIPS